MHWNEADSTLLKNRVLFHFITETSFRTMNFFVNFIITIQKNLYYRSLMSTQGKFFEVLIG